MSIKIHLYSSLQHYTAGQSLLEVSGKTVGECLAELVSGYPDIKPVLFSSYGELHPHIFVSINMKSPNPEKLSAPVSPGDELHVVLIVAGG